MLLILLCDELLGYSVILFALIRAFYLIFKGNYGTKTLLLWWGNFVIAIITTRMVIYLYHFFESMLCTTGLIFYTIVNLTKSDFNIFNLSQRFKSDFVFNIYLSCKIFIYGITIFLVYGCTRSFPEAFRNFIMRNIHKPSPLYFDILINIFLVILGLILLWCPVVAMWVETI